MEKTYKYDKLEHYKKKLLEGLNYASNISDDTKKIIQGISNIITPEIISKNSNYFINPDKFSFTEFKNEITGYIKENLIFKKDEKARVLNFIKMTSIKPEKEFIVYPEKRFDREIANEKTDFKYDFNYFKKNISLPDFLKLYGFKQDVRSTEKVRRMRNEATGELFLIRKNNYDIFKIWDPVNDVYRGSTIIDFVLEKHKNDFADRPFTFRDVSDVLTNYVDSEHFVEPGKSTLRIVAEKAEEYKVINEFNNLKPYTQREFLHKRCIDDTTIDSTIFKRKVFNHFFIDDRNKTKYCNTAFPISGEKKLVAISKRNESFKGIIGNKEDGVFITVDIMNGKKIDKLFIFESAVDILSHYQLNYEKLKDKKIRYISTEGDFSERQVELIGLVINKQQPSELYFCQDNDIAGVRAIAKILGQIQLDKSLLKPDSVATDFHVDYKSYYSKTGCWLELSFATDSNTERDKYIDKVINYFKNANENLHGITNEEFPFENNVTINHDNGHTTIRLSFNNHIYNWEKVNQFIIEDKFSKYSIDMLRERPLTKDFNDDLKALKDITFYSKIKGENEVGEFQKIYIGKDKLGNLYKSYKINLNDIKNSDWKPISNEEHNKLSTELYEEIVKNNNQNTEETKNEQEEHNQIKL